MSAINCQINLSGQRLFSAPIVLWSALPDTGHANLTGHRKAPAAASVSRRGSGGNGGFIRAEARRRQWEHGKTKEERERGREGDNRTICAGQV